MPRGLLTLATIAGVGAALALPAAAGAQAPAPDSVTGTGTSGLCGGDSRIEVDARSDPSGESPTGQVRCGSLFSGPVSCLAVSGNVALLTVESSLFGPVGVRIIDAGATGDTFEAFPGNGCPIPLSSYTNFPFSGDLVVVDAPPLPTSKAQCKNGGWRDFGVFRNQGDCVSFVATGGKNPPAG
jgi:hypothetical protein